VPGWPVFYPSGRAPDRAAFLARELALLAWQYLTLDFLIFLPTLQSREELEHMFGKGLEYRYLHLTAEQWVGRVSSSLLTWFFIARIMMQCWHRALSIVFVSAGLSRPEDWPPFFGSVRDAYTLRNFWG
jgi:hypothetical protein